MTEIILSFFAVIGITLLTLRICDFIFFHKFKPDLKLIVDIREKEAKDVIEIFELITTVRQNTSGKALASKLFIIINPGDKHNHDIAKKYLDTFQIDGTFYEKVDEKFEEIY